MSKYILILLASILIYIGYATDLKQKLENLKDQLLLVNTKIYQNEELIKNKEKILKKINKEIKVANENKKKLFSPNTNDSIDLGNIQSFVKNTALKSGIEVVVSNWGEPITKKGYKKLPVSFVIRAYPEQLSQFFNSLYSYEKFLKIDTLTIGKYRNEKLVLSFTIAGYKLEQEK